MAKRINFRSHRRGPVFAGAEGPALVAEPRTWLLRVGYRRAWPRAEIWQP